MTKIWCILVLCTMLMLVNIYAEPSGSDTISDGSDGHSDIVLQLSGLHRVERRGDDNKDVQLERRFFHLNTALTDDMDDDLDLDDIMTRQLITRPPKECPWYKYIWKGTKYLFKHFKLKKDWKTGETWYMVCWSWRFPHYVTFDGNFYTFHGACTYIIVESCDPTIQEFQVLSENDYETENQREKKIPLVQSIGIRVYGYTVVLGPGELVTVNGIAVTLPHVAGNDTHYIAVQREPSRTWLMTDFHLFILFTRQHGFMVILPDDFHGKLCGMMGDGDGDESNDLRLPNGTITSDVDAFGNAWKDSTLSKPGCIDGGPVSAECTPTQMDVVSIACRLMNDTTGPFKDCHTEVHPFLFVQNCMFDYCADYGNVDILCEAYNEYALQCSLSGIILDWRTDQRCPIECPSNSHYELSTPPCVPSCYQPDVDCGDLNPVSGCVCDAEYLMSGDECVLSEECGCSVIEGVNHKSGDVWYEDCSTLCTCDGPGYTCVTVPECPSDLMCVPQPDGSSVCACSNDLSNPPDCAKKCRVSEYGLIHTRTSVGGFLPPRYTKIILAETGPAIPPACKTKVVIWTDPHTGVDWVALATGQHPKPDKFGINYACDFWDKEGVFIRGYKIKGQVSFPYAGWTDGSVSVSVTEITPGARGWVLEASCGLQQLVTLTYDPLTAGADLVQLNVSEPHKWREVCFDV